MPSLAIISNVWCPGVGSSAVFRYRRVLRTDWNSLIEADRDEIGAIVYVSPFSVTARVVPVVVNKTDSDCPSGLDKKVIFT